MFNMKLSTPFYRIARSIITGPTQATQESCTLNALQKLGSGRNSDSHAQLNCGCSLRADHLPISAASVHPKGDLVFIKPGLQKSLQPCCNMNERVFVAVFGITREVGVAAMSFGDSAAVFKARAVEIGLTDDEFKKLEAQGLTPDVCKFFCACVAR